MRHVTSLEMLGATATLNLDTMFYHVLALSVCIAAVTGFQIYYIVTVSLYPSPYFDQPLAMDYFRYQNHSGTCVVCCVVA